MNRALNSIARFIGRPSAPDESRVICVRITIINALEKIWIHPYKNSRRVLRLNSIDINNTYIQRFACTYLGRAIQDVSKVTRPFRTSRELLHASFLRSVSVIDTVRVTSRARAEKHCTVHGGIDRVNHTWIWMKFSWLLKRPVTRIEPPYNASLVVSCDEIGEHSLKLNLTRGANKTLIVSWIQRKWSRGYGIFIQNLRSIYQWLETIIEEEAESAISLVK